MARKKKTDEEPVIAPDEKKVEAAVEAAPVTTPAPDEVPELHDTLEETLVYDDRNAMPRPEGKAVPMTDELAGERPAHKEKTENFTSPINPTLVADAAQEDLGVYVGHGINLPAGVVKQANDIAEKALTQPSTPTNGYGQDWEDKTFAQWALARKQADEERLAAEQAEIERERKAARMTGFAELGSALANLFGVAYGNASPQTYKQYSQDWMRKADADAREHRNHLADVRQRQADTELKMAQLRQQGFRAAEQAAHQRRQDALAEQKAALEAKMKQGDMTLKQYEAETKRLQALASAETNAARTAIQQSNSAQGWAKINADKEKHTNAMIQKGWVPDKKAEGGFRYDPEEAKRRYGVDIAPAETSSKTSTAPGTGTSSGFMWDPKNGKNGPQAQKPESRQSGDTQQEKKEDKTTKGGNTDKSPSRHLFD